MIVKGFCKFFVGQRLTPLFRSIAAFDSEAADLSHRPPRDQRRRALQRGVDDRF